MNVRKNMTNLHLHGGAVFLDVAAEINALVRVVVMVDGSASLSGPGTVRTEGNVERDSVRIDLALVHRRGGRW